MTPLRVFCGSPQKSKAPPKGYSVTGFPLNNPSKEFGKPFELRYFLSTVFYCIFYRIPLSLSDVIQIPIVAHVILYRE